MDPIMKEETLEEGELTPKDQSTVKETRVSASRIDGELQSKRPKIEGGNPIMPEQAKRQKIDSGVGGVVLPLGFLDPLFERALVPAPVSVRGCKQFWKAGEYEGPLDSRSTSSSEFMDNASVHPKFLHSNATSHKWVLGALAELFDNSVDEVCHGATFVKVDMLENKKDGTKMLLVEDNGGGMGPDKMRHCMSFGYSMKGASTNTIGQYGNGFKTSTMRLGADVIVFTCCPGKDGKRPTRSIGMLSYTFLMKTAKETIVVPKIDYMKNGDGWNVMTQSSSVLWKKNLETILQWSPYFNEADLLQQFSSMADHGTRIVIYNLWEDDDGELELDFDADKHDIQVRGVNRDEKKIQMAKQFPNSRHFLTYHHSLRSYASILYLRLPPHFRMVLRGVEIEHHDIVNDMMYKQELTYKPQLSGAVDRRHQDMVADVTIGFVKDSKDHVDVQGFNVYHKNRLIRPFWRIWNAAGSSGRGVIGVLEANFVKPAHDKQGFEHTNVLSRLEAKLLQMQKTYWRKNCQKIGYVGNASRQASPGQSSYPQLGNNQTSDVMNKSQHSTVHQSSPDPPSSHLNHTTRGNISHLRTDVNKSEHQTSDKPCFSLNHNMGGTNSNSPEAGPENVSNPAPMPINCLKAFPFPMNRSSGNSHLSSTMEFATVEKFEKDNIIILNPKPINSLNALVVQNESSFNRQGTNATSDGLKNNPLYPKIVSAVKTLHGRLKEMEEERKTLNGRIKEMEEERKSMLDELRRERDKNEELTERLKTCDKDQQKFVDVFLDERNQREDMEKKLRQEITVLKEKLSCPWEVKPNISGFNIGKI